MSNFFKILLGSCLGTLLGLVVLVLVGSAIVGGLASSVEQEPEVQSNSILTLDLSGLPELTGNSSDGDPFASLRGEEQLGLHDMIRTLRAAREDDDIKGLYLGNELAELPLTTLRSLREAVLDFKASGKFVVAYSPYYTQSGYYLATAADEIYMGPLGIIDFRGLGAQVPFFKEMLDKIGVRFEIFYAGDYKSATEPLRRTSMSPENREQTKEFLTDLFAVMLADIAKARNVSRGELFRAASNLTGYKEEEAVTAGLIDGIRHRTEIDRLLHEKVGFDENEELRTISASTYFSARLERLDGGDDEVAILFAEGTIVDGKGDLGSIGDKRYVNELEALTADDDVKAVVLRVNSGGGSASSSENIWYAVERLKAAGKPVVVSMGDYAASGGYYIAAAADSIFAEPTTITGSIGVFLTFPIVQELMGDKLGIRFDTVNTARNATGLSPFQDLSAEEKTMLTQRVQSIYGTFLQRVADGRNLPVERVREIAGGRVYSGSRAVALGLVDQLGTLDEAVASAARLANLGDEFEIAHYPRTKPAWEAFLEEIMGSDNGTDPVVGKVMKEQLGSRNYEYFELMRDLTKVQEPQARLPLIVTF